MRRPMQHLHESHSKEIREWVKDIGIIGYTPKIEILEDDIDPEYLNEREVYWIRKCIDDGCDLLNKQYNTYQNTIKTLDNVIQELPETQTVVKDISVELKALRRRVRWTQEEFAERMGIALTVVRKIEQGKNELSFSKLEWLMNSIGFKFEIKKIR